MRSGTTAAVAVAGAPSGDGHGVVAHPAGGRRTRIRAGGAGNRDLFRSEDDVVPAVGAAVEGVCAKRGDQGAGGLLAAVL